MFKNIEIPNNTDGIENMDMDATKFSVIAKNLFTSDEPAALGKKDLNNILNNPKAFMYQLRYQYHLIDEKKFSPEKKLNEALKKIDQAFEQGEQNGYWKKSTGKQNAKKQNSLSSLFKQSTPKLKEEYQEKREALSVELEKTSFESNSAYDKFIQEKYDYLCNM